jgi:hypothetical protein
MVIVLPPMTVDAVAAGLCGLPANDKAAEISSVAEMVMNLVMK